MTKISELPDAGPINPTDLVEVVQSGVNVKAPASALADGGVPGYIAHRSSPVDTPFWADEFDGSALDLAWGTILPSGTLSSAVGRGVLSLSFNAQAASDMAGLVQAVPASLPTIYAIETSYRVWNQNQNYLMAGPFIADGAATTSNVMWWMPYFGGGTHPDSFRAGTADNVVTNYGDVTRAYGGLGIDANLVRLVVDTTDSTIRVERSLDGVQWTLAGLAAYDRALNFTPSHFGFGVSTWGGTSTGYNRLCAVDYMRIYDLS